MADITLDSKLFQERISHFTTAWKNDLRSKDGVFGGAQSIVVMMGKVEEAQSLNKNNAVHVSLPRQPQTEMPDRKSINKDCSFGCLATNSRRRCFY
jgi:nucleosome binding factor SPN SPT16 subunit